MYTRAPYITLREAQTVSLELLHAAERCVSSLHRIEHAENRIEQRQAAELLTKLSDALTSYSIDT